MDEVGSERDILGVSFKEIRVSHSLEFREENAPIHSVCI